MTEKQWRLLLSVLAGEVVDEPPIAFIIDSPWRAAGDCWEAEDRRIIWSCGGGMPQGVPTENIRAFTAAVLERLRRQ